MNTRHILLSTLAVLLPLTAFADSCPPSADDFDDWGWLSGGPSGDNWMTGIVCASAAKRNAVKSLVTTHLGLDHNSDYWDGILPGVSDCNPDTWAARTVNGGYAAEWVGQNRENATFDHFACPDGILPDNSIVKFWLSQYVSYYVSEEGYKWECLDSDDNPGGGDGYTYASNPNDNSACSLYFPWFWNKTVMDRASTLVHEATHEFEGHLGNDQCTNGASCDDVFMNANAQSFQIVFDAQAMDAYQEENNSEDLKIVNFGGDTCGYLPLLPDQERFSLVAVMQDKLNTCFQTMPTQSQWPASAFIDNVVGTIYDIGSQPGGQSGKAYRIDVTNGAMWPCGKVCKVSDFVWDANGPDGPRSCNEEYQAGNAQINADNRARCNMLNAQVAAGVSPAEHASLKSQAISMKSCISGVSDEYVEQVCEETIPGANHVSDIEDDWSIPESLGYSYDAEEAILACQQAFCSQQPLDEWNEQAAEVCYVWDDPAGCTELGCGDLDVIEAAHGQDSYEYIAALVCRASELRRQMLGLKDSNGICQKQFNECFIRERYLPLWQAQLAGGGCWSADLGPVDPLYVARRQQIGVLPADRYVISDRGPGLLLSECTMKEMECEALQAALAALMAKIKNMRFEEKPIWKGPPLPDPWERLEGRFDRELELEMVAIGERLLDPRAPADVPLSRDLQLRRTAVMPEARAAMAELIGRDVYLSAGGVHFARGVLAPEMLQRFSGPQAERDPYALSTAGFEGELQALQTLSGRIGSRAWEAELSQAGRLDGATYVNDLLALLNARDGVEALAAHDALQADLQAIRR